MDTISLSPYAVQIELSRTPGSGAFSMDEAVIFLTEGLARRCSLEKNTVIGHIKGFCTLSTGAWMKVSVTAPDRPADREGRLDDDADQAGFILNVHVLGMTAERIDDLLTVSAQELEDEGRVSAQWRRHEMHHHGNGHDH